MTSAASGPENNGGQSQPAAEGSAAVSRPVESGLLERVLRQTLEICGSDEPIKPAEMSALREVAQRYRGRPLELEPVAVELVEAVIGGLCPEKKISEFWRNLCAQVAHILMDDPSTSARMNAFWIRLGGGTP